ncbi:MAG: AAA family ATPase [Bacteroidetes bacterium]|nr:MAG: AAA family ATPase [Bacteroidota bacterium]
MISVFGKSKKPNNYKFKSLRTYSWNKVVSNKKKFRKLFDRWELSYLSAELTFYNKLFDEENWSTEIVLKAFSIENGTKSTMLCEYKKKVEVDKSQNIVIIDYGWGSDKKGSFWEKGQYIWEAYIVDELVGTTKFYIEDHGEVTEKNNPYLSAISLRTYEAPQGDLDIDQRVYYKKFDKSKTRYVMGELRFSSKLSEEWLSEFFFNIYDDTGHLIGSGDVMSLVTPDDKETEIFTVTSGWGSENPGLWIDDYFIMEVIFMDAVVGVIPFSVGDTFAERLSDYEALLNEEVLSRFEPGLAGVTINEPREEEEPDAKQEEKKEEPVTTTEEKKPTEIVIDDRPLDEIIKELDSLIGLDSVKTKIRDYVDYLNFLQIREEKGFEEDDDLSLHAVFTGNPGTGKTTVVKLLGKIYHSIGLLSKGHVHTVEANDLISGFVRQTGDDTKKAIEKARGGILFIDEAYMLFKEGGGNDFGPEAVAALITEMSDGKGDIAIMVAGYPKEMESFLDSNPGLKSRFRNYFHFEDYTPDELVEIAAFAAKKREVTLSLPAKKRINKIVTAAFRKRDRTFGNARFAHSLLDEAKMNLGIRLMNNYDPEMLTKEDLETIREEDIEDLSVNIDKKSLELPIDNDLLKEALSELDQLTGLNSIKQEVQDMIKLAKYYHEMGRDVLKVFSMHSVFTGNPGTGKTTVARIMGKFYKALGLLERGHLIDADGSDLVAGFVGQTSIKTMELIKEAQGGILFIDEAYALTEGHNSDFGKKAVATLIKQMEDKRKEFGLIVAGYPQNMEKFLESNPGLKSRFDRTYRFEDFSEEDLYTIALRMLKERSLKPNKEVSEHIKSYFSSLYGNRDKFFGNARSVRKMVEKAHRNQELRMASLPKSKRTATVLRTLTLEDVKEFKAASRQKSSGLGFKLGG